MSSKKIHSVFGQGLPDNIGPFTSKNALLKLCGLEEISREEAEAMDLSIGGKSMQGSETLCGGKRVTPAPDNMTFEEWELIALERGIDASSIRTLPDDVFCINPEMPGRLL